ncbi:MAG: pyridoxine 5'-phosphate synthase [Desulfuromonadales bacterium]
MTMARLGVNVDHVATIRQARRVAEPDPVTAAALAELAGADGITVHLREDRRHIQDRDVVLLRQTVKTRLNLEMAATDEMVTIALEVRPDSVTLVPEKREELTTEGGLGSYCEAKDTRARRAELAKIESSIRSARELGFGVNAGHGLDYRNIREVVALGGIEEYNIGHSIVSRAVLVGMERAVREMVALVRGE